MPSHTRNRSLHDALRDFALEAAALLTADVDAGAELSFDLDRAGGRRTVLYSYHPLSAEFIAERWPRLRMLPGFDAAARALGSGAAAYLRVRGAPGDDAEPALRAMLERLYEDATGFEFPEERFERTYAEVEATLYEHAMRVAVLAPLRGLRLDSDRVELGDGLALVRGDWAEAPPEAVWAEAPPGGGEPNVLCVLEEDAAAGGELPLAEAAARFLALQTALRLFKPGGVALGPLAYARADGGPWRPAAIAGPTEPRGPEWVLARDEEEELREFLGVVAASTLGGAVAWALARFEMGLERPDAVEGLSDHLLALGALLEAGDEPGRAALPSRLAALCAHEGARPAVQRRVQLALVLERWVAAGGSGVPYGEAVASDPPAAVAAEIEQHLRALLRDVLCGYLEPELRSVADGILLAAAEAEPEPEDFEMATGEVRVRRFAPQRARAPFPARPTPTVFPPRPGAVESERDERAAPDPGELEDPGVTPSADWDFDEDPESYSAPV